MDYKYSKYNYCIPNKHGELLIYNSYSNRFVKIMGTKIGDIQKSIRNFERVSDLSSDEKDCLEQTGIIVPYIEDESDKLKIRYQEIVNNGTLAFTILPTEQCNFRCRYCNEPFIKKSMSKEIQDSLIKYLRINIHKYNRLDVAWFGGEPLLAADNIEYMTNGFLEICRAYRIPYTANITTNGYLLTEEMVRRMIKCHITSYQITVDGLESTHNFQKPLAGGGDTYNTVLTNLRNIRDHIKTKMIRIIIRTNITKEIYNQFDQYLDFYQKEFGDDERFSFFFRPAMDWGGETVKDFIDQLVDDDVMKEVYKKILDTEKLKRFDSHRGFFSLGGTVCAAAKLNYFTLEPDGKIHKCSQIFDDDFDTCIGKLSKDGKFIIDESKHAKWILERTSCDDRDCSFGGNCLSEFCPKLRINGIRKQNCPHEKKYIELIMQILDLDKNNYVIVNT